MNDHVFLTVCNTDRAKASTRHWRSARQRSMPPGPQLHVAPRYYAAQIRDMDGCTLEFVYES